MPSQNDQAEEPTAAATAPLHDASSNRSPVPAGINTKEWKLEESSLWWMSLDFFQNPGNILLITSVPFCMGAYYGYLQPADKLEEWVGDEGPFEKKSTATTSISGSHRPSANSVAGPAARALERESETLAARQLGLQVASRALGLATMGIFATFTLVGAAGFYLSGYRTVGEAMESTRRWASSNRQSFEDWFGMEDRESKTHPDVLATKHMSEEEEVNFVYGQILKEVEDGEQPEKK